MKLSFSFSWPALSKVTYASALEPYVTDWTTPPNFLGAYSAMLPGVRRRNPLVVGNMVFAGEAFVQNLQKSPSQMTGAWESGRIAGRKILKKLALAEAGQG